MGADKKLGRRHLGEVLIWRRKCSGYATETDELLQTGTDGHQRVRQNVEKDSSPGGC